MAKAVPFVSQEVTVKAAMVVVALVEARAEEARAEEGMWW